VDLKGRVERFLIPPELRANKDVVKLLWKIAEDERCLAVVRAELDNKQQELQKLTESFTDRDIKKQQHMVDLSMTLLNIAEHRHEREFQMDEIFLDGDENIARFRGNLQDLLRLVKFAYSTDPLTVRDEHLLLEVQQFINGAQIH
jgi:transcriptional regulator of heat shock response